MALTLNCQALTTLSCSVKGYKENLSEKMKIDEEITVSIDESVFLSIDGEGSDDVSFVLADEKVKNIKKITNLSNKEKWYLLNEGVSSKGDEFFRIVSINRLTGLISYSERFASIYVNYSGKCKKINAKEIKF
jgi:hypothetical protein